MLYYSLQTQCQDLRQQKDNLKHNLASLMKKLSEQSESLQISEKRLAVKVSEVIGNSSKTKLQYYNV